MNKFIKGVFIVAGASAAIIGLVGCMCNTEKSKNEIEKQNEN